MKPSAPQIHPSARSGDMFGNSRGRFQTYPGRLLPHRSSSIWPNTRESKAAECAGYYTAKVSS